MADYLNDDIVIACADLVGRAGAADPRCWHCDGTGGCPRGCDDGEIVLTEWFS